MTWAQSVDLSFLGTDLEFARSESEVQALSFQHSSSPSLGLALPVVGLLRQPHRYRPSTSTREPHLGVCFLED